MSPDQVSSIDPQRDFLRLRRAFALSVLFAVLLWSIKLSELALGLNLSLLGIYPGRPETLGGILLAPLVHGSVAHLLANTAPILVLSTALVYGYPRAARIALPAIYIGAGLGVWLFARPAFHLGASGLVFGMMFFVFTIGALRWDPRAIALSLIVFFLYGGMIWGIFPSAPGISFESHFFGAMVGVAMAVLLRKKDPPPPTKRYDWEDEDSEPWPPETGMEDEVSGMPPDRGGGRNHFPPEA
jgi:membrane associated rhomboid family serine protease